MIFFKVTFENVIMFKNIKSLRNLRDSQDAIYPLEVFAVTARIMTRNRNCPCVLLSFIIQTKSIFTSFIQLRNINISGESKLGYYKGLQFKLQPHFTQLPWSGIGIFWFPFQLHALFILQRYVKNP